MTDTYGNITWWGFSPALDLQDVGHGEVLKKLSAASPEELHILLVGAGDLRHILKTTARRYRHSKKKLKFYVMENSLELYVRDMLLMLIALEKPDKMGLQEKTELFLELYGNTLVREQSNQCSEAMAHELIKMVTDFDYLEVKLPLFDLTQLKYKERDFMEGILKFLRNREKSEFDISKCWDLRLRQQLMARYDTMKNVFDWDYNMELVERGGSIINLHQYKYWREKGVAFQIREGTYDVPNRTLSSATVFKMNGERHPRRGYWGDMIVSPYVAFGIETEEKTFYKKQNKQHTKTAEDLSEFNVTALLYELATNQKYELPNVDQQKSAEKSESDTKLAEIKEIGEGDEDGKEERQPEKIGKQAPTKSSKEDSEDKADYCLEETKRDNKNIYNTVKDIGGTESNGDNTIQPDKMEKEWQQHPETVNGDKIGHEMDVRIQQNGNDTDPEWMQIKDVKVTFLPVNSLTEMMNKPKYQNLFNSAFISNSMVHHLMPEMSSLFADQASLVIETALFMLDLKKDYVKEFVKKVTGLAEKSGFKLLETPDDLQDSYIKFSFER